MENLDKNPRGLRSTLITTYGSTPLPLYSLSFLHNKNFRDFLKPLKINISVSGL